MRKLNLKKLTIFLKITFKPRLDSYVNTFYTAVQGENAWLAFTVGDFFEPYVSDFFPSHNYGYDEQGLDSEKVDRNP